MMTKYFVTGVCGSIGKEIARQLLTSNSDNEVVGVDNNETEVFFVNIEFEKYGKFKAYHCDIRDSTELINRSSGSQIFFHAAAMKHVLISEDAPNQAIATNILGVQNAIAAAVRNRFDSFIFTSSDKAVNPTNVMGTTKLLGERLVTAAALSNGHSCKFSSTRFGNVVGSRGSVIPIFRQQLLNNEKLTVTHREMTRFLMSLEEAVNLVIKSQEIADSGDVIVTKMPVARIVDIAEVMLEYNGLSSNHIDFIGIKPGEKLYEELNSVEELDRTSEVGEFLKIAPALLTKRKKITSIKPYNSANIPPVSKTELRNLLYQWDVIN